MIKSIEGTPSEGAGLGVLRPSSAWAGFFCLYQQCSCGEAALPMWRQPPSAVWPSEARQSKGSGKGTSSLVPEMVFAEQSRFSACGTLFGGTILRKRPVCVPVYPPLDSSGVAIYMSSIAICLPAPTALIYVGAWKESDRFLSLVVSRLCDVGLRPERCVITCRLVCCIWIGAHMLIGFCKCQPITHHSSMFADICFGHFSAF